MTDNEIESIENSIVQIECINISDENEKELGTGFFIDKNIIATARHVIDDYYIDNGEYYIYAIKIKNNNNKLKVKVCKKFKENDYISFLELQDSIEEVVPLKFIDEYKVKCGDNYFVYGYPIKHRREGHMIQNKISSHLTKNQSDKTDWNLELGADRLDDYSGLSGAPVIIESKLVGIIQTQSEANGRAISIGMSSFDMIKEYVPNKYYETNEKFNDLSYKLFDEYIKLLNKKIDIELDEKNFINRKFTMNGTSISLDNIIYDENNYILLADAGCGKSQLLLKIISIINRNNIDTEFKIPVLLKLGEFGVQYTSVKEWIISELKSYCNDVNDKDFTEFIEEGKLIILLDALDEIPSNNYKLFLGQIEKLLLNTHNNKFIVTCRENAYFDEFNNYVKKVHIENFTHDDVDKYIRNRCNYWLPSNYNKDLLLEPLLLNIAAQVIETNGKLPSSRVELYTEFINELIQKWTLKKGIKDINSVKKRRIIKMLSLISFKNFDVNFISESQLIDLVYDNFEYNDLDDILEYILKIGILEKSNNDKIWFKHRTYKEYFTALYIVDEMKNKISPNFLDEIVKNGKYSEVLIFISGLYNDWKMQNNYLDYILKRNLKIFIKCVEEKNDLSESLSQLNNEEYCKLYLNTLLTTYTTIINTYFDNIKNLFDPYMYSGVKNNNVCIIGDVASNKSTVNYMYTFKTNGQDLETINIGNLTEYEKKYNKEVKGFSTYWLNLNLSNLSLDSAREVAIKDIKKQLKKILDKKLLYESNYLKCERLLKIQEKMPKEFRDDISRMLDWVNNKINECPIKCDSMITNGIEIFNFKKSLEDLYARKIKFTEYILPRQDKKMEGNSCWVWDLYSNDRLLERLKKYFIYAKKSIEYMIYINFYELKDYMPSYRNLPYKYIVKYKYMDNKENERYLEPIHFEYYYVPSKNNDDVELIEEDTINSRKLLNELNVIYQDNGYLNNAVLSSTIISRILDDDSLSRFVYKLLEENIEFIIGKLN